MKSFKRFWALGLAVLAITSVLTTSKQSFAGGKEIAEAAIIGVEKALVKEISEKPVKGAVVSKGSYNCVACSSELWGGDQGSYVSVVRCEDRYRNNRRYNYEYVSASLYSSWWNDVTGEYYSTVTDLNPADVAYERGMLTATGPGVDIVCQETEEFSFDEKSRTRRTDSRGYLGQSHYEYSYSTATTTGVVHPPSVQGGLSESITSSVHEGLSVCKGDCVKGGPPKG